MLLFHEMTHKDKLKLSLYLSIQSYTNNFYYPHHTNKEYNIQAKVTHRLGHGAVGSLVVGAPSGVEGRPVGLDRWSLLLGGGPRPGAPPPPPVPPARGGGHGDGLSGCSHPTPVSPHGGLRPVHFTIRAPSTVTLRAF